MGTRHLNFLFNFALAPVKNFRSLASFISNLHFLTPQNAWIKHSKRDFEAQMSCDNPIPLLASDDQ